MILALTEARSAKKRAAFCYGGAKGVAATFVAEIERYYPGIRTTGTYWPPFRKFTEAEKAVIAPRITASGADVV